MNFLYVVIAFNMNLLNQLPPPNPNTKSWCANTQTSPDTYTEAQVYPKISVIMPSYNQGAFIEETIRSILLQNYPALELIIMDGGSTDETVDILKKYDKWIHTWVSEKDAGQSDAMNKGWRKATGDVIAFINSDDYYEPGVLARVGRFFSAAMGKNMLLGSTRVIESDGKEIKIKTPCNRYSHLAVLGGRHAMPNNPVGYFYSRKIQEEVGDFDTKDHYSMDYRFLLKAFKSADHLTVAKAIFGNYRYDDHTKTFNNNQAKGGEIRLKLQRMAIEESAVFGKKYIHYLQKSHELTNRKFALPRRFGIHKMLAPRLDKQLENIDKRLLALEVNPSV